MKWSVVSSKSYIPEGFFPKVMSLYISGVYNIRFCKFLTYTSSTNSHCIQNNLDPFHQYYRRNKFDEIMMLSLANLSTSSIKGRGNVMYKNNKKESQLYRQ